MCQFYVDKLINTEAPIRRGSAKQVFLKNSQSSVENPCAGTSFDGKENLAQVFPCKLKFLRAPLS